MHTPLTVSIQGLEASFHEIAAKAYYQQPITLNYRNSFQEVFNDLINGRSDKIFVATHNSVHGPIKEVQALTERYKLLHEGCYNLPIKQHLIGLPGTRLKTIQRVLSHPVALSQCRTYLQNHCTIQQIAYHDTSAAVKFVKEKNDPTTAAIGSASAARLYGLEILKVSIQDDPNNTTIFRSFSLDSVGHELRQAS